MQLDIFLELPTPPLRGAASPRTAFEEALAVARAADRAGFGAIWVAEHHFLGDYSNASAPELLLAAIARETRRIGLGFAVIPLPLHDPVRVAERLATLDLLSEGRVLWGVGRGITPTELEGFGIDPADSRSEFRRRYAELAQALATGVVVRGGRTLELRPTPRAQLARGWMAAVSPESYTLAAELGLDVMAGPFKPWPWVQRDFARYRRLRPEGRTSFTLACYCESDHRAARARAAPGIVWGFEHVMKVTRPFLEKHTQGYEHYRKLGYASALLRRTLSLPVLELLGLAAVGDPAHVARRFRALAKAGVDRLQLVLGGGDLTAAELERTVALMAEQVLPALASDPDGCVADLAA